MRHLFSKFLIASLFFTAIFIVSCDDDDDENTGVDPNAQPAANFSFNISGLEVSFSNSSTNASDFTWDFGDGGSSTERNPTHTYTEVGAYSVKLTAINGDASSDTTQSVSVSLDPENVRLTSGFVVVGRTADNTSIFARYYEELPSGTIDISQGTAFQSFAPVSVVDGAMFMNRTDGENGFEKVGINGNQEFVEDGIFSPAGAQTFAIAVRDSEFGVFHDRANPDVINTFNPTTMEVTGQIDMSAANASVENPVRYQDFIFRGDNEIFAPMREEVGNLVPNMLLPRIDIAAGVVTGVAEFEGLGDVVYLNTSRRFVDESGNLYIGHIGNLSVPTISGSVLRIPTGGNDYDASYNFEVPLVNNSDLTNFGSFMGSFNYWKDDIGFVLVNESVDPQILEIINNAGGIQSLTPEEFATIETLLFSSPTGAFVQVNLGDQTVSKIEGMPSISVFDPAGVNFIGGQPYFAVATPTDNAFYQYNEATNSATKVFDMTGGFIAAVIDLSQDIQ